MMLALPHRFLKAVNAARSSTAPESEKSPAGSFSTVAIALLLVLMVLVLYVLSLGPAVMLTDNGYLDDDVARFVYSPLIWLHEHTPLRKPLDFYVELWE